MFSFGATSAIPRHTLEITVVSAEALTINGCPVRNKAYVIVRTDDGSWSQSGICCDGGLSPTWHEKLLLDMPRRSRDVVVEVRRRGRRRDKFVGTTRIPVSDFTGEYFVPVLDHLHFLSYRLWDSKGLKNGIINVSIRVTSLVRMPGSLRPQASTSNHGVCRGHNTGSQRGMVVTGFPAWYADRRKS
ncbi:hypothetical protein MLD38_015539 [Melastoma candidum]|uniref:Uncharacterized protein n=1 Tax=Melastoma candidum TaxID=119954 RepID=A0ACB9RHL5_9MYRT|nr:hypothetical protein MLD38_015539 [Melastoma candidum]